MFLFSCQFANGGFEVICRESTPHGFTNHRINLQPAENCGKHGWEMEPIKAFEQPMFLEGLSSVSAHCRVLMCSANPFISAAAGRALEIIQSGNLK